MWCFLGFHDRIYRLTAKERIGQLVEMYLFEVLISCRKCSHVEHFSGFCFSDPSHIEEPGSLGFHSRFMLNPLEETKAFTKT